MEASVEDHQQPGAAGGMPTQQNDLPLDDPAVQPPPSYDNDAVVFSLVDDEPVYGATKIGGGVVGDHIDDDAAAVAHRHRVRNAGFVQVSKIYIDEMNHLAMTERAAHKVLWTLVKLMDKQNAVMISQESLAAVSKCSKATVKRAVQLLRSQQWLEVLKMGTANVYRVNSEVVWQDKADGRWASFSARVVLNFAEQDEFTKNLAAPVRTRHIPFVQADDLTGTGTGPAPDDGGRQ